MFSDLLYFWVESKLLEPMQYNDLISTFTHCNSYHMEDLMIFGFIVLLVIVLFLLNKIIGKINVGFDQMERTERNIWKLNDKIDALTRMLNERKIEVLSKESSIFEDLVSPEIKAEPEKTVHQPEEKKKTEEIQKEEILLQTFLSSQEIRKEVVNSGISINPVKKEEKQTHTFSEKTAEKTKKIDFEKLFGENILSKIGITTLVLGIAYFIKYAIDQNWIGETGRVAIGVLIGIGIIGITHKLRAKYLAFSALLAGGGISVLYISITLAYREYELFSQTTAFIILIVITILSVLLSLYYNQRILAIFSILGGFASPLLVSSGTGSYITLFSYIFILNTGMLILAYKKKWVVVSLMSYFLTYIFYGPWLFLSYEVENRNGASCFSILFFLQFYILVLIEYFKVRKISPFQVFIILSNNFLLYVFLFYLFRDWKDIKGAITLSMAVINIIPVLLLLKSKQKDRLFFHLLIAIVITFVSLSIPVQLKGSAITMFWGVEALLLLWLFKRSGIKIFSFSFLVLEILALGSLFIDYLTYYFIETDSLNIIINPIFITGTLVIIYLCFDLFILRKIENSVITLFKTEIFKFSILYKILSGILLLLLFVFPFTELTYQLYIRNYSYFEIALLQGVYTYLFAMAYTLIKRNRLMEVFYYGNLILIILYPVVYLGYIVLSVIQERFYKEDFSLGIFLLHFLTIPAFVVLITHLCRKNILNNKNVIYWIASIASVYALSVETDNLALIWYDESILESVHTIAYPVIWGFSALILIIAGMKYRKVILRKISLVLFALIILKLYLYDVWKMTQAGRIISFVILGLILLGTSFLYQKLKVLIRNDEETEEQETLE